jgi:hypothetical protein
LRCAKGAQFGPLVIIGGWLCDETHGLPVVLCTHVPSDGLIPSEALLRDQDSTVTVFDKRLRVSTTEADEALEPCPFSAIRVR